MCHVYSDRIYILKLVEATSAINQQCLWFVVAIGMMMCKELVHSLLVIPVQNLHNVFRQIVVIQLSVRITG